MANSSPITSADTTAPCTTATTSKPKPYSSNRISHDIPLRPAMFSEIGSYAPYWQIGWRAGGVFPSWQMRSWLERGLICEDTHVSPFRLLHPGVVSLNTYVLGVYVCEPCVFIQLYML